MRCNNYTFWHKAALAARIRFPPEFLRTDALPEYTWCKSQKPHALERLVFRFANDFLQVQCI